MKILHVCLASFYIDNYSYQENILPKYHKLQGNDVTIIASLESFDSSGKKCYLEKGSSYINENNIPVIRLNYKGIKTIAKKIKIYKNTFNTIVECDPDIIFVHGVQFRDVLKIRKFYLKRKKVTIYIDNHADFSNSARNWLSYYFLHKIFWLWHSKKIEPFVYKFYGVLPSRVDFLKKMYHVDSKKICLLRMGADDEYVANAIEKNSREIIRNKFSISKDDILLVTGGKIDGAKTQIFSLLKIIRESKYSQLKLLIFGSVVDEIKEKFLKFVDGEKIIYTGWSSVEDSYDYFSASDLVVFPGRHSVYWEQVVGQKIPLLAKYWEGTTHIDIGGNVFFLTNDSYEELDQKLQIILSNENLKRMKVSAMKKESEDFLYSRIAEKSISC